MTKVAINIHHSVDGQRWNGRDWIKRHRFLYHKGTEVERKALWAKVEKALSQGQTCGPVWKAKISQYWVYPKTMKQGLVVGIYVDEKEACLHWDNIQRKLFDFPAPVNFPTVLELEARKKEKNIDTHCSVADLQIMDNFVNFFSGCSKELFEQLPLANQLWVNFMLTKRVENACQKGTG